MPVNSTIKSNRLLQSRRYTHDTITDAQDVFDRVLDLSAAEIYSQQNLIPTSSIPALTNTGDLYSVDGEPILKYWNTHSLTPSSVLGASNRKEVWFFLETPEASTTPFQKNATQQGNFISNKYAAPNLNPNKTTDSTRGYRVVAWKNSVSPSNILDDENDYVFDYKTGVLEFLTNASASGVNAVYMTAYQYVGRTLASDQTAGYSGSFSGSFQGDGSNLTNVPAGSITGLSLNQIAAVTVTASVGPSTSSFTVASASVPLFTVGNEGAVTASLFTGSLEGVATGSFTGSFEGIGTGSFTGSLTGIGSGSFSGSFEGDGGNLTNVPASSIVGLNLSRIASGSVSASIGVDSTALQLVSASNTLATFNNQGGLTLTNTASFRDASFTGSVTVTQNLTVLGTASFTSVTSSELFVSGSRVLLHTNHPAVRFGGLDVIDDAGTGTTGSLLWDSLNNKWVYSHPAGIGYDGGMLMSGPRNTSGLGNEVGLTHYYVARSQGGDHIENSNLYSSGSRFLVNKTVPETTAEVEISGSISITGSTLQGSPDGLVSNKYAIAASQSAWFYSTNVGYPVGNQWGASLSGSVFQNYNHNTDTATVLRLIAGYLSASLPIPLPNGKTYSGTTVPLYNNNSYNVATNLKGLVPQDYENSTLGGAADVTYLVGKGFASVGNPLFDGVGTVYYQNTIGASFTSVAGGTTTVSSSVDAQLFGLSGLGTTVYLSGSLTFKYSDNISKTTTATSQSNSLITQAGPGTGTALKVYSIPTANAAVISPVWQDGKYVSAFARNIFNGGTNIDSRSSTSISSSGYYYYTGSLGLSTGSSTTGYTFRTTQTEFFWAPADLLASSLVLNTITVASSSTANTVVSRSLSGAPYISSSTYSYVVTMSGLFEPLYANNDTIGQVALQSGPMSVPSTTATINSSGFIGITNTVFDAATNTARSTNTVPFRTDQVRFNVAVNSNYSTNTNIQVQGSSSNTFVLRNTTKNRANTSAVTDTTLPIFTPNTFGQPLASGSMAYFGRAQGSDPSSNSGTTPTETFYGENYRRYVSASTGDVLAFTAPAFSQSFGLYNLPDKELQVKPGFLVKPGGTYGYWITDPSPSDTFKYYVKEYVKTGGANSIVVDFYSTGSSRPTLVTWYDAGSNPDGIAAAIMFESTTAAILGSTARFFNLSAGGGTTGTTFTAGTTYNPFGSSYLLYNGGANPSAGRYTMVPDNNAGAFINSTYTKFYLVIRYKGDPAPLTQISVSYT